MNAFGRKKEIIFTPEAAIEAETIPATEGKNPKLNQ